MLADPPPMPRIGPARVHIQDALAAMTRADAAWNETQLRDAIRSARYFLDKMESALDESGAA